MAPQATAKPATTHRNKKADKPKTIKSKYFSNDDKSGDAQFDLPWPKKRRTDDHSISHEPSQVRLQSLPAGSTRPGVNKEQYKRKYGDAFDFRPKTAPSIKEEPQDEVTTTRSATLTQHFATSKPVQPATAPKVDPRASKGNDPAEAPQETTCKPTERSAVITALAYVQDGAVTEAVAALVLRWAREQAPSSQGDVYDAGFIRSILDDLEVHRIDSDRRAFVTEMLSRPLQKQLETLRSSSESLLSCLASINTPQPSSPLAKNSKQVQ
ncbi:hypothetical protein MBLNU13_g05310t1 [Cladosporium sp. NU13]